MRTVGPILLILLLLGLFGGFAWLTRNPETPWLEKAEEWPFVGELASRFRTAYLGPAARRDDASENGAKESERVASREPDRRSRSQRPARTAERGEPASRETTTPEEPLRIFVDVPPETSDDVIVPPEPPDSVIVPPKAGESVIVPAARVTGRFTFETRAPRELQGIDGLPYKIREWIWCLPGNRILADVESGSGVPPEGDKRGMAQEQLSSMAYLPVLGRQGVWAQVMYRGRRGWIDTSWEPPYKRRKAGRGILRHRYEPVRASDSQRLKQARKILGMDRPPRALGAYTLYTDVEDEEVLGFLYLAAGTAEDAYFARYGRLPSGNPKRSVVLFARRDDYRRFTRESTNLSGNEGGHAGRGVLAFFAEGRSSQALARTLIHEIGHLLNDRAIALLLPPWLEEGMASDLGSVWVEGTPDESTAWSDVWSFIINGPDLSLLRVASTHEARRLPSVGVLMSLDRKTFHSSPAYAYAHSATFVRYLLDSEDAGRGEPFRTFLKRVAGGYDATPALLLRQLDTDVEKLDERFRTWLLAEAESVRQRLGMGS